MSTACCANGGSSGSTDCRAEAAFERLTEAGILDPELSLRMRKAVGFRSIAVHAYDAIDWEIVHTIATDRLQDFKAFARTVAAQLDAEK